jgi:hypothetical protein
MKQAAGIRFNSLPTSPSKVLDGIDAPRQQAAK